MGIPSDEQLLQDYLSSGSETAFSHLVDRYTGLVFGVAMRGLGQRVAAEEVTQNVFVILSRKARHLARRPKRLPGWLHRSAVFESRNFKQRERTRERNMQAYQNEQDFDPMGDGAVDTNDLPITLLDAAIDSLSQSDRRLVFLRFFEERRYKDIGEALGKSEDACQKQLTRALKKLSAFLQRRGASVTVATLTTFLTTELAKAAPANLGQATALNALTGTHTLTPTQLLMHTYPTMLSTKAAITLSLSVLVIAPLIWLYTHRATANDDLASKPTASGIESEVATTSSISVVTTTDRGAGESDILLTKTAADGSEVWSLTFGGTSYERAGAVAATADGGYVIIGSTSSLGKGNYDVWLVKTDSNGREEWSQTYGTFFNDYGFSIAVDADGHFLLGGQQQVCESENDSEGCEDYPWLAKVNSNGTLLWERLGEEAHQALEELQDAGTELNL